MKIFFISMLSGILLSLLLEFFGIYPFSKSWWIGYFILAILLLIIFDVSENSDE